MTVFFGASYLKYCIQNVFCWFTFFYLNLNFSIPFLFWLLYSFSHILNGRHKCHFCGSSHATKSAMQNHISIYHGQLKCQFCDESYATKLLLQFHINTKHRQEQNSDVYKCQFCGSSHACKQSMNSHITNYHQQEQKSM